MITARGEVVAEEVVQQDIDRSLRRIQEAIDDPTGRLKLYLNNLSFPHIDFSIERIKSLEQLFCNHNPLLSTLPYSVCQLPNLRVVDLHSCALSHLPEDMSRLRNLERLDLSHNLLSRLVWDVSGWVKTLKYLNVGNNRIEYFSPSCMELFLALRKKQQANEKVQLSTEQALTLFPNPCLFKPKATSHMRSVQEEQHLLGAMLPSGVESCANCGEVVTVGQPRVYVHFWVWLSANDHQRRHEGGETVSDGGSSVPTRSLPTSVEERHVVPVTSEASHHQPHHGLQSRIPIFYALCTNVECHMQLHKHVSMSDFYTEAGVQRQLRGL
jgi:hypothetical protein